MLAGGGAGWRGQRRVIWVAHWHASRDATHASRAATHAYAESAHERAEITKTRAESVASVEKTRRKEAERALAAAASRERVSKG